MKPLKDEFILFLGVILGESFESHIKNYFLIYKNIKIEINGNDLKNLGYKPSKKFGEILEKILELKINGEISTKDEELDTAIRLYNEM
jgi:tRNA nucleotidyltransferase (CCA-adding enzyme)